MDDHCKLSRRSVLRRGALLAGAVLTAGVVPYKEVRAQQKATKEAMKYQDKPSGDKQCSNCLQFAPPGSCKVVEGAISPSGYCIAWVKKA
jgi:hypothetical protein